MWSICILLNIRFYCSKFIFENIPKHKPQKSNLNYPTIWNTNKEDGWKEYKSATDNNEAFENIMSKQGSSTTDDMDNLNRKLTKKRTMSE